MYKKVQKSVLHPYGICVQDQSIERPFICFVTPAGSERDLNGYLSNLESFLCLRKDENIRLGIDVSDVEFDLYALGHNEEKLTNEILSRIDSLDVLEAKKKIRYCNFMSFCDGNRTLSRILLTIYNGLLEKGFTEEETMDIMSQISILQVVDNGKFSCGTVNTIHVRQDMENRKWLKEEMVPNSENFSKVYQLRDRENRNLLLIDAFGEEALTPDREHAFTGDYAKYPVINSLISICLITSLDSSLTGKELDLNSYQEGIDFVLGEAFQYEQEQEKKLEEFTKKELEEFSQYMMNKVKEYIEKKYSIKKQSEEIINQKIMDEKEIKKKAWALSVDYLSTINNCYEKILAYQDKPLNEKSLIVYNNENQEMYNYEIVRMYFNEFKEQIQVIVDMINFSFSENASLEIRKELVVWKKNILNTIKNMSMEKNFTDLLQKCGISMDELKIYEEIEEEIGKGYL